ncbi:MAG: 30S ribosomal protein S9 [uncultured bacterium]|nr:MAG: 30S ribosomal protein S9 [uncultured bacterium]
METKAYDSVAVGRRKNATARICLKLGSGQFRINGLSLEDYFPLIILRKIIMQPLVLTKNEGRFDFTGTLSGGGKAGQAGALRHAIARVLIEYDEKLRPALKEAGFLTRDPRMKERKKYGRKGARRRFQFSKR